MKFKTKTALSLLLSVLSGAAVASQAERPNILLLVAEDMSAHVKAFGDDVAITPNIDALAQKSIIYPNSFTTAGVCAPSRTGLITGVHQAAVGGQHMRTRDYKESLYRAVPAEDIKAFPELLRKNGYYTFVSSKLDYQFSEIQAGTGPFTIWDYEGSKPSWRGREKDQPFFGMYHFNISHESALFPKKIEQNVAEGIVKQVVQPEQVSVPAYYPDTQIVREAIAQVYNNVSAMDRQIGAILNRLKKDGLADNTIVIWTTDHGDGLPRAKREIYDSGIKVPLVLHWPEKYRPENLPARGINEQLISFVDIAPSILTMANIDVPSYIQGSALLADQSLPKRDYIFASKDRLDEFNFYERAVRSNKFKYIRNYLPNKPGGVKLGYREQLPIMAELWRTLENGEMNKGQEFWFKPRPAEELYDIINDPDEVKNLADNPKYKDALEQMRGALTDWQHKVKDYSKLKEFDQANLFWPQGKEPVTPEPTITTKDKLVVLSNSNKGASLGYKVNNGKWKVYSKPVSLKAGDKITAKAVRYGWKESSAVTLTIK
ncbi:sulfatase [Thalassomonas sp. M1454]|uniref:sulfatase family protein n=1 Tax=Thalassomonas sp. M1454 TaxID=2594477 RepID=UPI00117BE0BC|nr:sulfatase [Thalassomonas sp. M1454]TRX53939.1 sulfatase [Thalassomonas sp. M1454]